MTYSIEQAATLSRPTRVVGIAAAVIAITATIGCGKPSHQLETAPFRGKVTLDGQPLTAGYVTFVTARGRSSSGEIQPDGTFEMSTYQAGDGAQVGSHPVVITPVPQDVALPPGGKRVPIPERYQRAGTSGFTAEVKPGEDNYTELKLTTEEQKK
jgi:hypothetical protein